jgi:hypothetical protein
MRGPRIKVDPTLGEAVYHCVTRSVAGERLFGQASRERLRRQLWQVADYCGVEILTYALLSNHFHVLVRVPQKAAVSDAELLRRHGVLHPQPTKYEVASQAALARTLQAGGSEAEAWRRQQLALMGDISPFMKLLKQRFSIWFNQHHDRYGTLWAERFKSVLVESGRALMAMAAYIDLNCIRAGLAGDSKDYRFCGYAEAVAGREQVRQGLATVVGGTDWASVQAAYRQILFSTATELREQGVVLPLAALKRVLASGGRLSLATVLRCRVRYFTDGAVLGSREFVEAQLAAYRARTGQGLRCAARPLPAITDWGDLATLRRLRSPAFG